MQTHPTILLSDSDELNLFILQRHFALYRCGVRWVHCRTAEQALAHFANNTPPALFIIDPVMPDMQPKAFLEALHAERVFYKTVACIVSPLVQEEIEALTAGYSVFGRYARPVSHRFILEMINASAICTPTITSYSG